MSDPRAGHEITRLLRDARSGDDQALADVMTMAYDELRLIAHRQLSRLPSGGTLNPTAVVHEAFLKLSRSEISDYSDRMHFFAVAAKAMRQILIDYARSQQRAKRGGKLNRVTIDRLQLPAAERIDDLVELDEALERLAALNPRLTRVVECRFFGGLTAAETAAALNVTERTVRRDWAKARAWLYIELQDS